MDNLKTKLPELLNKKNNTITIEATVPTGFENVAINEILDNEITLSEDICFVSGRVYFKIVPEVFVKVTKLRSVDNVNLVVDYITDLKFNDNKNEDVAKLVALLNIVDLQTAAKTWASLLKFDGNICPTQDEHDAARNKQDEIYNHKLNNEEFDHLNEKYNHNVLKYRVTCDRIGQNHSFTSNDAAYEFGGEVNNKFRWIVALSDWDLNILLRIQKENAMICFKLTSQSLHRRCLIDFGPTSLRPTISFGMLSLAKLKAGDHIVDPLCGSGSIPIECMYGFPNVMVTCGDIHFRAVDRTFRNIQAQDTNLSKPDIFKWDSIHLPFKNHQIDAIVTDLPFGKRSGSKKNNAILYKKLIKDFARVLKLGTGRLVVLSHDTHHLYKALQYREPKSCWNITNIVAINVGALKCNVIVARRKKITKETTE